MSLYRCTIAIAAADRLQVSVHWDDNDPNRCICAPVTVSTAGFDEAALERVVRSMNFELVSRDSDNLGRGWAIVAPVRRQWPFFDPVSRQWFAFLSEDQKCVIRETYPGSAVAGVR